MMNSGLGNKYSSIVESNVNDECRENFDKRIQKSGRVPGTHTLGAEFKTTNPKVAEKK